MPAPIVPGSQTTAKRLHASAKATRPTRKPKTEDLTVLDPAPTVKRHRATKAEMEARRAAEAMGTAPVKPARKRAVEVAVSAPRVPGRKPVLRPREQAEAAFIALMDALDARYHRINGPQV